ncbi:Mrp/NBP35 family ATP-binding protein [Candidatus Protochlamydia amoebophila]|uniref:Iron-sulfur cluster carrier protein n=1 Tax=Candidatus Protochlamydia amoebophila TaxID=362787 RepID=A0A0C1JRV7_9BACT|nr:Mrp/NBP35 family ATP-binding protein [Candidatus Protochlamydia amoebophila]KIC73890.1 mrp protein [Candidatus Protochlamydia amoebophila]
MPLEMYQAIPPLASIKSTIGIAAGKGGVGKSTVTVNLALALKGLGYRIGIMDTDLYGPSIRKMLPEDRLPSQKGEIIQPALCNGIKMISMAYFRKETEATAVRAPIANRLISQFINQVAWGELDYLLIDFPPGTGDIQITLSQKSHLTGALLVTTPQEVALLDVQKAMSLFNQVKVPIVGIVENMSYYVDPHSNEPVYLFGKEGGKRLARETGYPCLGQIPLDPLVGTCGDKGKSLFSMDSQSEKTVTQAFIQLAQLLVEQVESIQNQMNTTLSNVELVWKEMKHI